MKFTGDTLTIDLHRVQEMGENVVAVEQDGKLILIVDTNEKPFISRSGKVDNQATTHGFRPTRNGLRVNLTVSSWRVPNTDRKMPDGMMDL